MLKKENQVSSSTVIREEDLVASLGYWLASFLSSKKILSVLCEVNKQTETLDSDSKSPSRWLMKPGESPR